MASHSSLLKKSSACFLFLKMQHFYVHCCFDSWQKFSRIKQKSHQLECLLHPWNEYLTPSPDWLFCILEDSKQCVESRDPFLLWVHLAAVSMRTGEEGRRSLRKTVTFKFYLWTLKTFSGSVFHFYLNSHKF